MDKMIYMVFGISLSFLSCTSSRIVKPLPAKTCAISTNVGGPLVKVGGVTAPVPLSTLTFAYGVSGSITGFGSIYPTSMLFGVGYMDFGTVILLDSGNSWRPAISVTPQMNLGMDFYQYHFKWNPQLDFNVYWKWAAKGRNFLYMGIHNWFEFVRKIPGSDLVQDRYWLLGPHVGNTFGSKRWRFNIEVKWNAANQNSTFGVVEYVSLRKHGAIGMHFSVTKLIR